ncbi:hypothetical protein T265_04097 [Opisthorchis viverrini]|uniref:Uncharacterized protein n=1 Tax=Opisthorchis viverrini TaxID=6198 RepID=A0A074ZQ92_OPIVI|nr:hypothetical protein T265_04097 [Opisthorchis viverrini]KER29251.1 hypothetical protein T265_04097 [Opisthorchis viverrini]
MSQSKSLADLSMGVATRFRKASPVQLGAFDLGRKSAAGLSSYTKKIDGYDSTYVGCSASLKLVPTPASPSLVSMSTKVG